MILPDPPILVITDRARCAEGLEARAAALFQGGCRWLSVREKDLAPAARRVLLERLLLRAGEYGATVGVHDDVAAALALGLALHLPARADARAARALSPAGQLGQSCHDEADIVRAAASGVDYVTLSPFFDSASKAGYRPAFDLAALSVIAGQAAVPVIALGGITSLTAPRLPRGIAGCAIMGEAMATPEPAAWFARIASVISTQLQSEEDHE